MLSNQCVHSSEACLKAALTRYKLLARDLEAVILPEDLRIRGHYPHSVPMCEQWEHGPSILSTPSLHDKAEEEYTSPQCKSTVPWQGCLMLAMV